MTRDGKLRIGTFIHGLGLGNWQDPEVPADATVNIDWFVRSAQIAERGLLDFAFIADAPSAPRNSAWRFVSRLEPLVALGAVARETSNIGLVGTATTSYTEPFSVARQFATLDLVSRGRAGWNVVTSASRDLGLNFSAGQLPEHDERYRIAAEYVEVVRGLWGSWDEDAFLRDKVNDVYHDPDRGYELDHVGEHYQVKGPLHVERSAQGSPVIFQAGSSAAGKAFSARHAEAVFSGWSESLEHAQQEYAQWKRLAEGFGRNPDDLIILPAVRPIVGRTREEAEEQYEATIRYFDQEYAVNSLGTYFGGFDFSKVPLDGPFPEGIEEYAKNAFKSSTEELLDLARREDLSIREAAMRFLLPSREYVGPAEEVAEKIEHYFHAGALDGLILTTSPTNLERFIDLVIPILQKRGVFRTSYESPTLRGLLGLPTPTGEDDRTLAKRRLAEIAESALDGTVKEAAR